MENVTYPTDRSRRKLARPEVRITMVETQMIDAPRAIAYWKERGIRAKYTTLENRGGNVIQIDKLQMSEEMTSYTTCTRLMKQAYIHFNGDVVLCCVDNSRKVVFGNVKEQSLHEIWNAPAAVEHRRRYLNHDFAGLRCAAPAIDQERRSPTSRVQAPAAAPRPPEALLEELRARSLLLPGAPWKRTASPRRASSSVRRAPTEAPAPTTRRTSPPSTTRPSSRTSKRPPRGSRATPQVREALPGRRARRGLQRNASAAQRARTRILDFGCGTSDHGLAFALAGYDVADRGHPLEGRFAAGAMRAGGFGPR
jgi:hypothetical protein